MKEIRVTVRDKIATGDGTRIVCGNSDYTVRFDLDSEWDQFITRTMLVVYADRTFDEVVFKGDCVELPVVINQLGISIGLYAGDLRTTTPAYFDCIKSARCGLGQHANPPEDVYNQLVGLVESGAVKGDKGDPGAEGPKGDPGTPGTPGSPGKTAYQYAQDGGYTGTEAEFSQKMAQELPEPYTLPPATPDTLGGIMPGDGLVVDEDGRVNVVEDGCELIDELTLQEAVSEFSLNVTPDGKPYNFRRMIIVVNKPAVQTSGYMWLTVNNMDKSEPMNRLAVVSTHDENERNAWCDMSIVAGRVRSVFADASVKAASIVYVGTTQSAFMNVKATSINAIRYNFGNFPAGTKIMIYGEWRRDNE